ncbi:CLEC16A isoform X2, partial [Brachionus plicatilis]
HTKKSNLIDLIDEYIDHLNYLQDIYMLDNQALSNFLTQQLIRRLFVPVFLSSLRRKDKYTVTDRKPYIQPFLAVFLLSHVLSIITYQPLVTDLCDFVFFMNDEKVMDQMCERSKNPPGQAFDDYLSEPRNLVNYLSSLSGEKKLSISRKRRSLSVPHFSSINKSDENLGSNEEQKNEMEAEKEENLTESNELLALNITDDEKYLSVLSKNQAQFGIIFENLLQYLNSDEYDELNSLICLSFMYTLVNNPGLPVKVVDLIKTRLTNGEISSMYNETLMDYLIKILEKSVEPDYKVRLATLEIATRVIKSIACVGSKSCIGEVHMVRIEQVRVQSASMLRESFRTEEMFLDMFEHEYHSFNSHTFSCEMLLREWSILLTPRSTPLSGIELTKRFPCGDTEKLKHLMRTFFLIRNLCLNLNNQIENQLPLTKQEHLVKENDALDLNSSDLIACTVNLKEKKDRRFLVIDPIQFILVEPEVKRIGWGIVKFSDLIQDVEVTPDKEDSRSLNITIKKSTQTGKPLILLNSAFTFDDHIRCMAAKQHLVRARDRARRMKLEKIAQLLDLSTNQAAQKPIFMHSQSHNDILPYNLVAGYSLLNNLNHPGRASMISSTWSQIAQAEKHTQLMSSPMAAFSKTSSPVHHKNNSSDPNSISVSFYKNQVSFTSPSLATSSNSNVSLNINKCKDKIESLPAISPKNTSDSGVQVNQNESDDFLATKLKESIKPLSDCVPLVSVNSESCSDPTTSPDDPSIQYY